MQVEGFFAVSPKRDCPHCTPENIWPIENYIKRSINDPCIECNYKGENWICLKPNCGAVACSRYVKSHMVDSHRAQNQDHPIVFSFADFSFWCYMCDSYVQHVLLNHMKVFYNEKFPEGDASIEEQLQKVKDVEFTGGDAK